MLYYHILRLSIGILLPHQQPATHNDEPKKNSSHLLIPFLVSAGIFAILIARCHMAVIIRAGAGLLGSAKKIYTVHIVKDYRYVLGTNF